MRLIIDCLIYKKNKAFGYQEYLFNLLNYFSLHIDSFKYKEIIIVCDKEQTIYFKQISERFNIKAFSSNTKLKQIISQNLLKYKLNIKKDDVILYTYNYSSIIKQGKSILVIHDLIFKRKEYLPNRLMRIQRKFFIPISIKNADKIIAISNATKDDIILHYQTSSLKIETIYNYFNFRKFHPINNTEKTKQIQSKYFLSVSSMAKHKNIITLLEAFKIYAEFNFDIDLVLIGSVLNIQKNESNFILNLPESIKKRIYIIENLSNQELGYLYSRCECFILPTFFEGLGMPIVEAMHFNIPLVLSDIKICKEIAENNAIYFLPSDYKRLAEILIKKEYLFLSSLDNSSILEKFNKKNTSHKYIQLINSIHN